VDSAANDRGRYEVRTATRLSILIAVLVLVAAVVGTIVWGNGVLPLADDAVVWGN
jgi:hypothetical protein